MIRKIFITLTAILVLSNAPAYGAIHIVEDFNNYTVGTTSSDPSLKYAVYGGECTSASIVGDGTDNSLQINFHSTAGKNPIFSYGLIQKSYWTNPIDLSGGTTISFDIKTDISQTWAAVLTPQLTIWTYNPSTGTSAYERWCLQNYAGQVWGQLNQPLLDLNANDRNWRTISVNVDDFIFNSNEQHWKEQDLTNVVALDFLVLQLNTDILGEGTVSFDNITVNPVPEPGAMLLCGLAGLYTIIRKKIHK